MRLLLAVWVALLSLVVPAGAETGLVRTQGKNFVTPDGKVLHIKGISLGNWLMPEGYMFKFEVAKAPRQIYGAFERLLGAERAASLLGTSIATRYIAEDDIRFIKSVGFNTVRIPLHWGLFMTADGTHRRGRAGRCSTARWAGRARRACTRSSTSMPPRAARPASTTTTGRAIR